VALIWQQDQHDGNGQQEAYGNRPRERVLIPGGPYADCQQGQKKKMLPGNKSQEIHGCQPDRLRAGRVKCPERREEGNWRVCTERGNVPHAVRTDPDRPGKPERADERIGGRIECERGPSALRTEQAQNGSTNKG